jgi:hypothetical protein
MGEEVNRLKFLKVGKQSLNNQLIQNIEFLNKNIRRSKLKSISEIHEPINQHTYFDEEMKKINY